MKARARQDAQPDGGARARSARGGAVLSRRATGCRCCRCPPKSEFPGTGPAGNGITPSMKSQARMAAHDQVGRLHGLPSARQQGDARDPPGARHFESSVGGVGAALQSGQAGAHMMRPSTSSGASARSRCSPTGPIASRPARCRRRRRGRRARAQRRHHGVGLGGSEGLPARRGLDRSPQPDASTPTARSTARSS